MGTGPPPERLQGHLRAGDTRHPGREPRPQDTTPPGRGQGAPSGRDRPRCGTGTPPRRGQGTPQYGTRDAPGDGIRTALILGRDRGPRATPKEGTGDSPRGLPGRRTRWGHRSTGDRHCQAGHRELWDCTVGHGGCRGAARPPPGEGQEDSGTTRGGTPSAGYPHPFPFSLGVLRAPSERSLGQGTVEVQL